MKKRKGHGPLPDGSYPRVTLRMLYPCVRLRIKNIPDAVGCGPPPPGWSERWQAAQTAGGVKNDLKTSRPGERGQRSRHAWS